jgi:hypothetical protein
MTRVELTYELKRPLVEADYERLSRLTSVYGVMGFEMPSETQTMVIEYDASRLTPDGVDRVVRASGLPLQRN